MRLHSGVDSGRPSVYDEETRACAVKTLELLQRVLDKYSYLQ
jgi:hypothetical protein